MAALHALVDPATLPREFGGTLAEAASWLDREEKREGARAAVAPAAEGGAGASPAAPPK